MTAPLTGRETLAELPPAAHLAFLCPYCQTGGLDVPLSTANAERLEWAANGTAAIFHNIGCGSCGKTLSFKVSRLPAGP